MVESYDLEVRDMMPDESVPNAVPQGLDRAKETEDNQILKRWSAMVKGLPASAQALTARMMEALAEAERARKRTTERRD